jgi:3alpha(or 20beta)-hydroxysteroid dehydrogenase
VTGAGDGIGARRLDGKVAIITGAAGGQGAAEARLFAAEGARVMITDVRDDEGASVAAAIGDAARYLHHDVGDESAWTAVVTEALAAFGRLDVLVNNAGIYRHGTVVDTSLDDYLAVITVNQVGTFLGMKAVAPTMMAGGGGSIINISSLAAYRGGPGKVAYASSKWAVRGMTKVAAFELASHGIRVNSVHPGGIDTAMLDALPGIDAIRDAPPAIPMGRFGSPDEVARLVLWLASDESSYSTGSEFVIDGGATAT